MCTGGMKVALVFDHAEQRYEVAIIGYLGDKKQLSTVWSPAAARALAIDIVKMADLAQQRDAEALVAAKNVIGQFRLQEGA